MPRHGGIGNSYPTMPIEVHARYLASGELTSSPGALGGRLSDSTAPASGELYLTHFTSLKSESCVSATYITGVTAAAATPTLVRYGLYSEASDGALEMIASTTNDTALLAAINTPYNKAFTTPVNRVAGLRYALGLLIVTGAARPTLISTEYATTNTNAGTASALRGATGRVGGYLSGQANLPQSITNATLVSGGTDRFLRIAAILPT